MDRDYEAAGRRAAILGMGLAFVVAWGGLGWAAQAVKIGVVDVQQVLNQSQRGQVLKQKLEQERSGRQKDLDVRQQELMKLQAEYEKQAPVLSEQAKREKKEALERRLREARRVAEDANRDFEKRVRETEMETTREIFTVIQEYGKDQGFSVILERSSLIFSATTVDVTTEIIKRYDGKGAK
ncbi:MAG: OmpH family outer membrane protein [Zetaproteobacteria bacterium]|nr:MAG: OmpH family outer membrane protein [Zetaproteobacteria bacterium]